jgi:hypothetical protein
MGGGVYPKPVLIDASSWGVRHWAADAARLTVDLVARHWRAGITSMIWDEVANWVERTLGLCPFCNGWSGDDTSVDNAGLLVDEIVSRLQILTAWKKIGLRDSDGHWQWHAALAKELVRQAAHDDLTQPRAALCFVSAAEHLSVADALLRQLDGPRGG